MQSTVTLETVTNLVREYVHPDQLLMLSAANIIFNPLAWNIVARREYHTHFITRLFGGSAKAGCYFLALVIFSCGMLRDYLFNAVVSSQPAWPETLVDPRYCQWAGMGLYAVGLTLVLSSTWALGITGTYLGDYFGILLPAKVTCFPFNVMADPMYTGSTLNFLGHSIMHRSPVGCALTLLVFVCYKIAQIFEDSFTNFIYSEAAKKKKSPTPSSTSPSISPKQSPRRKAPRDD